MSASVERHASGTITPRGPTLNEFALARVELVDPVIAGIANKKDAVIVHRHLGEMAGTRRRSDHVSDKLVVPRATLRLENTHAFICVEARVLSAVTEVNEILRGVIEKPVRIRLHLRVLSQ